MFQRQRKRRVPNSRREAFQESILATCTFPTYSIIMYERISIDHRKGQHGQRHERGVSRLHIPCMRAFVLQVFLRHDRHKPNQSLKPSVFAPEVCVDFHHTSTRESHEKCFAAVHSPLLIAATPIATQLVPYMAK